MITEFGLDDRWMKAFAPCMDAYGCGDSTLYEWPNNVLSVNTVVYESGVIARRGERVEHRVDAKELEACRELSARLHAFLGDICVGMKSEADTRFVPFFRVANVGAEVPASLDEAIVRRRFGNTIMPLERITVEPLAADGLWWEDLTADEGPAEAEDRWRALIAFAAAESRLHGACFVQIGFSDYAPSPQLSPVEFDGDPPPGFAMRGSCLPRLALAITDAGSLVGVFGYAVWT